MFTEHRVMYEIMPPLHKIIHRPCCEQFYLGKKRVLVSKKLVPT